jgi:hypothetical protein
VYSVANLQDILHKTNKYRVISKVFARLFCFAYQGECAQYTAVY